MAKDPKTSPYFDLADRSASIILDRWEMPARDRANMRKLITRALCDAYATGFQNGLDAEDTDEDVAQELSPDDVADAARQLVGRTRLVSVPELVRVFIDNGHDLAVVHQALLASHHAKLLELRPESGVGLLSASDAALCPRGMRGIVLSWVRVI